VTVDKLDAEDLGSRKGGLGSDSQVDSLGFRSLLSILQHQIKNESVN
jgi:hypothetical protein